VSMGHRSSFPRGQVLATFPTSLRAYYSPPMDGVAGGSGGSRILA